MKHARRKLGRWCKSEEFRNAVFDEAIRELDLETPLIVQAMANRAKKGRVDAAKFTLELTGRYKEEKHQQAQQVVLKFGDVPRPQDVEIVDAEATED